VKTATPLLFSACVNDTVGEGAVLNVTDPVGVPAGEVTITVTATLPYGTGSGTLIDVVVDALRVVKVHVLSSVISLPDVSSIPALLTLAVYCLK
jgi:hypothetical protein